jgi:hypothetical protein
MVRVSRDEDALIRGARPGADHIRHLQVLHGLLFQAITGTAGLFEQLLKGVGATAVVVRGQAQAGKNDIF